MTTQVLYHALGVDGYTATRRWEKEGVFCLQIEAPSSCHRCPKCGRGDTIHRGTFDRTVHAPRIGICRTQLLINGPRLSRGKEKWAQLIKLTHARGTTMIKRVMTPRV